MHCHSIYNLWFILIYTVKFVCTYKYASEARMKEQMSVSSYNHFFSALTEYFYSFFFCYISCK